MIWNNDISQAPRGKQVTVTRQVMTKDGYEPRQYQEHHIAPVWLARADGKVVRSYWIPETKQSAGRWSGFAENEQPVAWQNFIVPEHPFAAATQGEAAAPEPKNVSLANGQSSEGANAGGDHVDGTGTAQTTSAGEHVSGSPAISTGHVFLEDVGGNV